MAIAGKKTCRHSCISATGSLFILHSLMAFQLYFFPNKKEENRLYINLEGSERVLTLGAL